ncbi:MAG TPA: TIR domain-containing protein, partial [Anaerolineae bacterium]|nr:TIR domain-containing protein [Anaerolineae bacterium]
SDTNLRGVEFWRVNFTQSTLQNADFEGSAMIFSTFAGVDLRTVKGLNTVTHLGTTYIDTNTLTQFNGDIPESFLRGCGLSDLQIETAKLYNPRLTSKETSTIIDRIQQLFPAQYHSCFISYSSKDKAFAQRLHADLQQNGVRCWFAPKDMRMGDRIRSTIDQSIRTHDKLMVILSENSINSEWVETEVETAFEEERKRKQTVLFPVRLDVAVMETEQAWAANIRTRHIGDFSRWKDHNEYQQAFERLLKDLKAEN